MIEGFTTKADRRATLALQSFCSEMRQSNPYVIDEWSAVTWEVGVARRASARLRERLHFTRHAVTSDSGAGLGDGFREGFASFARAIVVYRALNARQRPTALAQMVLIRALRYLYEELLKFKSAATENVCPTLLRPVHFDMATQALLGRESAQSCYRVANYLEYVASQVDRLGLTSVALRWHHGVARPEASGGLRSDRIGKAFQERRKARLPDSEVLYAVADVSNARDLSPSDAIRQRLVDLLFCGGFRINENLTIRRDALVEEVVFDDLGQPALDSHGGPMPPYVGIRYMPEKGGDAVSRIKWIPSDLVPIARRAFIELTELTADFAEDAKFAYTNAGRVRFGEPWDSLSPDAMLTTSQIKDMVGLANLSTVPAWVDKNVGRVIRDGGRVFCSKQDVERAIADAMGPLEVVMQETPVPLHEFLAVVPVNFFHSKRATIRGTATLVSDQNISDYLCGRGVANARVKSIFERRGSCLASGDPIRITTHQFRHFLDTVAATGGVSELVRARWMGRKDLSQNSAYDHETGASLARKIRLRLIEGGVLGPIAEVTARASDPVARESLAEELIRAVHKTQLGRCYHDWASSPCPEHEGCWGCDEHLLIKGSPDEVSEAERQLNETLLAIEAAESEQANGTYGVDNWANAQCRKRDRLREILSIHRDPNIADGTPIHLERDRDRAGAGSRRKPE